MINKIFVSLLIIIVGLFLYQSPGQAEELTLKESIETARENNPELKVMNYDIDLAEIEIDKAEAGQKPQISLSHSYTRQKEGEEPDTSNLETVLENLSGEDIDGEDLDFSQMVPEETYAPEVFATELGVEYPLYTGGRLKTGVELAEEGLDVVHREYESREISLSKDVAEAYYEVLEAQSMVDLNQDFLDQADEFLELTEDQLEAGTVTESDVLQAEAEKAEVKRGLKQAESGLEVALRNFRYVLGVPEHSEVRPKPEEKEIEELDMDNGQAYREAEENNPDLGMILENQDIADHNLNLAEAEKMPEVFLSGNYNWQDTEWGFDDGDWSIMAGVNYNIFDGGNRKAEIKSAEKEYKQLEARYDEAKEGIEMGIDQTLIQLEEIYENISHLETQKKAAEDNLELTSTRYEGGMITALEVTSAQTELRQTQTDLIRQKYEYMVTRARLTELMGYKDPHNFL